jgi:tRNA modification GTPase
MSLGVTSDTIAAISTALGSGAIGIVRISGPDSRRIAAQLFTPSSGTPVSQLPPNRVTHGVIRSQGEIIDEALLLTFHAPRSYTGQDLIELQTHGGPAVLRDVLAACIAAGARQAGPGEFTLRAYLNGRMDLVQAESVLALIEAQSSSARRSAAHGLSSALSARLNQLQDSVTRVYGNLQAQMDYPDEGVEEHEKETPLRLVLEEMDGLLATAAAGRIARTGARLALIGRPNAGKSSLLNALLGYQRSLVSATPGTTRDYLEAPLELDGLPLTLIDTAGIRDSADAIEAAGVLVSRQVARTADLILLLLDPEQPSAAVDAELLQELDPGRLLLISSKSDLLPAPDAGAPDRPGLRVSAVTGEGLSELRQRIRQQLLGDAGSSELWISVERHAQALQRSRDLVQAALHAPDDLAALDLAAALGELAGITGRSNVAEETLVHIFANFCVGK